LRVERPLGVLQNKLGIDGILLHYSAFLCQFDAKFGSHSRWIN